MSQETVKTEALTLVKPGNEFRLKLFLNKLKLGFSVVPTKREFAFTANLS